MSNKNDHTAAFAEAFFIANLLFAGIFYLLLWILFLLRYDRAGAVAKNHLKQAMIGSTITTVIFLGINVAIMLTSGYNSIGALIALETYFMILVPLFFLLGIIAFTKAIKGENYFYPVIGKLLTLAPAP